MISQNFSKYRIQKILGREGPGEVYLALDTELDRTVVLQFLSGDSEQDPGMIERLVSEAKSAARLHHPNIVTVYEVGEHAGRSFIAMEYVGGRTLAVVLASESIAPRNAVGIAIQLCEGLGEARRNGLFHRDLTPENILIDHDGLVRIAGFGFAAAGMSLPAATHDLELQPPERARGEEGDERSDVYTIGALLARMDPDGHSSKIVSRATADQPADRYASVETLATDLGELFGRLSGGGSGNLLPARPVLPYAVAILLAIVAAVIVLLNLFERSYVPGESARRQIIAVLPFDNLGDAEDEYFADGITDEITARLSRMLELGVISRTSARSYKNTQKSVREIGQELNADYIIEGTIRWSKSPGGDRVRITPQLIRVTDDTHVWADNYEREITEIFAVQADIAANIVAALNLSLLESEHQILRAPPTDSFDAYQAYLLGMKHLTAPGFSREKFELGIQMFERALSLDPDFALAYARLSTLHSRMFHYGLDRSDTRLAMARAAVDSAFRLQPNLPEAHLALGYYHYWGRRDYESALAALEVARTHAPQNPDIMQATAYVMRRQGNLEACAELVEHSLELSPLDANACVALGETYGTLRRYADGERSFRRGIALAPDDVYPYTELALMYLRWRGDTVDAHAVLDAIPSTAHSEFYRVAFLVDLLDRDYSAALTHLAACPDTVLEAGTFYIPVSLFQGITYQLSGDSTRARTALDSSRLLLEGKLVDNPDDYRAHSALGITHAGLGQIQNAVSHGEHAVQMYPIDRDALEAPVLIIDLALIYTMVGRHEAALEKLDYLLSIPSILSAPWLAKDPRWDPLRQYPQFANLLRKYSIDPVQ